MLFKTAPAAQNSAKAETTKEENTQPKRSFKEVMAKRPVPQFPSRRSNVFDLASKEGRKPKAQQKKKHSNQTPHVESHRNDAIAHTTSKELSILAEIKSLSIEMRALLDKMADFVQLESQNGISTTTVSLEMEGSSSIFNGAAIQIDHYDTAPHSFNIQLSGNPEAIETFTDNLASLQTALQQRLEHFQIELLPPILSEKMQPLETHKKIRKKQMRVEKPRRK